MNIGLNLFSVRNLIQTEEELVKNTQTLFKGGYSYLQYSGAEFDAERIARTVKATGVPVYLTHVPLDRIVNDTQRLMEEHALFGCENIGLGMLPVSVLRDEKEFKRQVALLERAAEKMEKNGFRFFYHNHHNEFFKTGNTTAFDYMIENAPHINFTLDTYWVQYGGRDIISLVKRLNGRIGCVHLKDYKIEPFLHESGEVRMRPAYAPLGEGNLDLPAIVAAMREAGTRYFFVEQDDAADLPDGLEQVLRSAKYAREEL